MPVVERVFNPWPGMVAINLSICYLVALVTVVLMSDAALKGCPIPGTGVGDRLSPSSGPNLVLSGASERVTSDT